MLLVSVMFAVVGDMSFNSYLREGGGNGGNGGGYSGGGNTASNKNFNGWVRGLLCCGEEGTDIERM